MDYDFDDQQLSNGLPCLMEAEFNTMDCDQPNRPYITFADVVYQHKASVHDIEMKQMMEQHEESVWAELVMNSCRRDGGGLATLLDSWGPRDLIKVIHHCCNDGYEADFVPFHYPLNEFEQWCKEQCTRLLINELQRRHFAVVKIQSIARGYEARWKCPVFTWVKE